IFKKWLTEKIEREIYLKYTKTLFFLDVVDVKILEQKSYNMNLITEIKLKVVFYADYQQFHSSTGMEHIKEHFEHDFKLIKDTNHNRWFNQEMSKKKTLQKN